MQRFLLLMVVAAGLAAPLLAHAQGPDRGEYQHRFDNCAAERQRLAGKLGALRAEKQTALEELRQGYFCSKCKKSKSSIEKTENFETHLGRVKGERVAATPSEIAENQNGFQAKIHDLEIEVDSKRLDCESISMDYQKAAKDSQAQAQQEAQQNAEAQAQREADERQRQLVAQQQREEEARQAREAERLRREEAERVRQAQLAANLLRFEGQIATNNADKQAKLDEARRNGTLDGIAAYSNDTRRTAQGTVSSTNNRALGEEAFGSSNGRFLAPELYETSKEIAREKLKSMMDDLKDSYKEQVNNYLFGEKEGDEPNDNNKGSHWDDIKQRISDKLVQKLGNRILEVDRNNGGVLNRLYAPYEKVQKEMSNYDSRTLRQFNNENMEFIGKGFDAIQNDEDTESFNKVSDKFFQNTPKRFYGVMRNWFSKGNRVYLDELTDN